MPNATRPASRTRLSITSFSIGRMSAPLVRVLLTLTAIAALLSAAFILKLIPSVLADTTTPVSIASFGTAVTQNFDTLVSSGTGTLAANTPPGWGFSESSTNANTTYSAGTGSGNGGDTYSFGSAAVPGDRALGQLRSGSLISILGGTFQNNTGGTITSLAVSYIGEQWRLGATGRTIAERMDFQYSTNATSLTTGTWIDVNALDFNPPITVGTVGALDGNAGANRLALSSTIPGLSISNGASFWIRWTDIDATGADDGLAVDDFSITATGTGPTNPTGVGAANPNSVNPGATSLLTVAVTPGTNPTSAAHTVSADLTAIGGSASQTFFDNATNGDVTAGDNTFSYNATVAIGTSGGVKNLPATITETSPMSRTGSASISLTVVTPTPPTGVGAANPSSVDAGNSSLLTVTVTPGANPTSTGLAVSANLSSIGGSASQQFYDDGSNGDVTPGNNVFSYNATVTAGTTAGAKSLPFSITDSLARTGSGNISLTVSQPPVAPGTIVISQIYGGGGNSGATYTNDFVELFNRGNATVSLAGWSVQYTSSGGTGSWSRTPLTGTLAPGQYYLVQESAGAGGTTPLPTPDATGTITMAAGSGHIALVTNNTNLPSGCPNALPQLMDLVGYGTAACFEGAGPAPGLDNVTADFRSHLGCKDTDSNGGNFFTGSPNPRNSSTAITVCPVGDFEPEIFATSPANNETHVPNDGNITINFDEPVNVTGSWFQISCTSGPRTATVSGGPTSFVLNPDTDFGFNEPCTVTIFASQVTDQDFIDPPDNLSADCVFSFNSEFFRDPAEHMVMGNPNGATADTNFPDNYLMMKTQYAFSYNNTREIPNWTSWHLDSTWRGSAPRQDDFRNDTSLPPGFHQVLGTDYVGSGFDRGHMCPSADRTSTIADNSATFLMDNMIPQGPGNNQGPWASLENSLRTFLPGNEVYILSGGQGVGGIGSNGPLTVLASGVTVPAKTWKAGLILAVGDNDVSRVDTNTRIIAVIMPNDDAIRPDQWQKYLATVDQIEALTGYDLYSNVPANIQDVIEARVDAANDTAPVTVGQTKTVAEDGSVVVTLAATDFNVNNTFTFTVVDQPSHGSVLCTAANCTYSPGPHYFGPDSFTFKANDSALDSNVSTVSITVTEVNNDPTAVNDSKQTAEDSSLNFAASDLTGNDSAGPGEGGQALTVESVISTPNTHGSINLSAGQITYTPSADYNGPASFDYHVCDDGTTNGIADPKCTFGTVDVSVTEVNDAPSAATDSKTTQEDTQLSFAASDLVSNDSAGPANESGQTLTVSNVTATVNTHGTVSLNSGQVVYTPAGNYNGPASFEYEVCDDGTTNGAPDPKCTTGTVNVTVSAVNDNPDAVDDAASIAEDSGANSISVRTNDSDVDADTVTVTAVTQGAHGSVAITGGGTTVSYTPAANFFGGDSFTYTISDGNGGTDTATVTVTVTNVEDAPDAVNDSSTIAEDSGANGIDVRANDSDLDGDTLTVTAVTQGAHGTAAITGGGTGVSYTPAANFFGSDSFTYTVNDGQGGSGTATVNVTITNVNDAPVATGESYVTNSNTTLNVAAPGVLSNDSDIDGPSLSAQLVSNVSDGTLSLQNNGSFSYTPGLDFEGSDSFTYQAFDGLAPSNAVTVNITINDTVAPVLTSAVAVNLISSTNSNLINVGLTASATDNSGDPVTIQVAVFGDEDDQTPTANNVLHSPDAKDIAPITLRLRGERIEANDGRVYLIVIKATDSSGNISRNYRTVVVPKNSKQASTDSVNTQAAAAVSYAQSHAGAPPPGYFVIGDGPIIGPKQ